MTSTCSKMALAILASTLGATSASAAQFFRWTTGVDADLPSLVQKVNGASGFKLRPEDFTLGERRQLAFTTYERYDQRAAGVPIRDMALRVWRDKKTGEVIQFEANVERPSTMNGLVSRLGTNSMSREAAENQARDALAKQADSRVLPGAYELAWQNGVLTHRFSYKGKRGRHHVVVDARTGKVIEQRYVPFPDAGRAASPGTDELSVAAQVYPIYEEYKGQILERKSVNLNHLVTSAKQSAQDPFAVLRERRYLWSLQDPVRAGTPEGQEQGYWSYNALQERAVRLGEGVPSLDNRFGQPGLLLQGKYVGINIHPDVLKIISAPTTPLVYTPNLLATWKSLPDGDEEIVPSGALAGKRWVDASAVATADARRDPQHDVATYMVSGYDEIQVYYAVNQLFEALQPRGFTDPDLSTRPFQAFLFNPDIEMKNNAYYDADTINFTTYSPDQPNMARDNLTIWHELGHGVMDRMMGGRLNLADTGGLSEGMADFVAEMVLNVVDERLDFPGVDDQRIMNKTGFFLTNEVHDDGEAYGGVMKVILDAAKAQWGRQGIDQVIDLTLEAMRLSRDHPHLTAQDWFDRMLYADSLGREGLREPNSLRSVILEALASRNFASEAQRAQLSLSYNDKEIEAGAPGSRGRDIPVSLPASGTSSFALKIGLKDGEAYKFHYPVRLRIYFNNGPLQGAIHWQGEENEPQELILKGPSDPVVTKLTISGTCDHVNRDDGSCSDYAYVQVWNDGDDKPVAKKRFYLRLKTRS